MNIYDIINYKSKHGPAAAADLLILMGPDHYNGDYERILADIIKEVEKEAQE